MNHAGMIQLPRRAPGMRERIRQLEAQNKVLSDTNAAYERKYNEMAENMTHLLFRLEGVRDKFGLTPDQVNGLADEYLAKISAQQEMQRLAAANVKKFTVNGVDVPLPSSKPEGSPAPASQAPKGE